MKSWQDFVLAIILIVAPSTGLAGELIGQREIPPQRTAILEVKDFPEKAGAFWRVRALEGQNTEAIEWITDRKGPKIQFIAPYGKYEISCTFGVVAEDGSLDLDIAEAVITFGTGPGPGPGPEPEPEPNAMVKAFQAAYDVNTEATKAQSVASLVVLYRQGANMVADCATSSDLYDDMRSVANAMGVSGKVTSVQQAISLQIVANGVSLASSEPLTQEAKDKIKDVFTRVADALATVK